MYRKETLADDQFSEIDETAQSIPINNDFTKMLQSLAPRGQAL